MQSKNKFRLVFGLLIVFGGLFSIVSCSVLSGMQEVDPQSATLTALVTPTSVQPTLDLKGNEVLEEQSCQVFYSSCISTFSYAEDGGVFRWADNSNLLAYVVPENRYWAWFSGDAAIVNFESLSADPDVMYTTGLKVFGDFAFNPSATKIAFVVLRPSEKLYSVMVATLGSKLQMTIDLFADTSAKTDNYSSSKSVLRWESDDEIVVSTSCGIDCEQLYTVNTVVGEQVRKKGHDGRVFKQNVKEFDDRIYPAMLTPNWSPDGKWIFYTDEQDKTWILNDETKQQFELPISAGSVNQTAWSYDGQYIAVRFLENLAVYKIECND